MNRVLFVTVVSLLLLFLIIANRSEDSEPESIAPVSDGEDLVIQAVPTAPAVSGSDADQTSPLVEAVKAACPESIEQFAQLQQANTSIDWDIFLSEQRKRDKRAATLLTVSSSAYDLLTAAFLERDEGIRVQLLDGAVGAAPEDGRILLAAMSSCIALGIELCDRREWASRLVELEPENSEAWAMAAADAYERGEREQALRLLEQAAAVSETRSHWPDLVEIMQSGLSTTGTLSFSESALKAFDVSMRGMPFYSALSYMCRDNAEQDAGWARACLEYGRNASSRRDIYFGEQIQRSIEISALRAMGRESEALEVQAILDERRREYSEVTANPENELIAVIPEIFELYLADIRQVGELAAMRRANENTRRLLTDTPQVFCAYLDEVILESESASPGQLVPQL